MSISLYHRIFPKFEKNPQIQKKEDPFYPLLYEIWKVVLSYIFQNSSCLKHVGNTNLVCKFFLKQCIEQCTLWRTLSILKAFNPTSLVTKKGKVFPVVTLESSGSFKNKALFDEKNLQLLSVGEDGRQYLCKKWEDSKERHILCIRESAEKNTSLDPIVFIDISIEISKTTEINRSFVSPEAQRIISCYQVKDGFLLVTRGGFSLWSYEEEKAIFKKFYTPFDLYHDFVTEIQNSAYRNNILYLQPCAPYPFFMVDLSKEDPQLENIVTQKENGQWLVSTENQLLLASEFEIQSRQYIQLKEILINPCQASFKEIENPITFEGVLYFNFLPICFGNWLIHFNNEYGLKRIYVIHLEKKMLWIGNELEMQIDGAGSEIVFVQQNFLFISYIDKNFRVIYLPTKKEFTRTFYLLLRSYFEAGYVLLSFAFVNTSDGIVLNALLKSEKVKCPQFFSVKVFLEKFLTSEST